MLYSSCAFSPYTREKRYNIFTQNAVECSINSRTSLEVLYTWVR